MFSKFIVFFTKKVPFHLRYKSFSLKDQGWLENDIENRGVRNLPNYHYYEDAKPMFEAIHDYIQQCIKTIYG